MLVGVRSLVCDIPPQFRGDALEKTIYGTPVQDTVHVLPSVTRDSVTGATWISPPAFKFDGRDFSITQHIGNGTDLALRQFGTAEYIGCDESETMVGLVVDRSDTGALQGLWARCAGAPKEP